MEDNKFWWSKESECHVLYTNIWGEDEQIAELTRDKDDDDEVYILHTSNTFIRHMDGEFIFSSLEEAKEDIIQWLVDSIQNDIEYNQKYLEVFEEKEDNLVVEQKKHSILGQIGYCPSCNRTIHYISCGQFCGHCGKNVKWNLK